MEAQPAAPYRTASPPKLDVPDHQGERQPRAVYWTPPPPEVGKVLSAWSNQDEDGYTWKRGSVGTIVVSAIVFGPIAVAFVWGALTFLGIAGAIVVAIACAGFGYFVYIESKQRPWCSYFGDAGFSEHKTTWRRVEHTVVRFDKIAGVFSSTTDHYTNGVYQHTIADYEFCDASGLLLAKKSVTTHERGVAAAGARLGSGKRRNPDEDFMAVVSEAWRKRRTESAFAELEETGAVVFPVKRGRFFTVRADSVDTDISGKTITFTAADIISGKIDSGVITLKTARGKLRFAASEIADHLIALPMAEGIIGRSLLG